MTEGDGRGESYEGFSLLPGGSFYEFGARQVPALGHNIAFQGGRGGQDTEARALERRGPRTERAPGLADGPHPTFGQMLIHTQMGLKLQEAPERATGKK